MSGLFDTMKKIPGGGLAAGSLVPIPGKTVPDPVMDAVRRRESNVTVKSLLSDDKKATKSLLG